MNKITEQEIIQAQKEWGEALIAMRKADNQKEAAEYYVSKLYAYDTHDVLFKPTRASEYQFRTKKDEAVSYFVTGHVKEDTGFALMPIRDIHFETEGFIIREKCAIAMGNYFFKTEDEEEIKVEFTFCYIKDDEGNLKIILHHSSFPFIPEQA